MTGSIYGYVRVSTREQNEDRQLTADELLSGTGGNTETKTEQAERLILDLLADGKEMASEDISIWVYQR